MYQITGRATAPAGGQIPDCSPRFGFRIHQRTNGIEHDFELAVGPLLELVDSTAKLRVLSDHLAQPHERPHDFNVDCDRTPAA